MSPHTNYNKLLTRFNVPLQVTLKKVFEKYSGHVDIQISKPYTILFPNDESLIGTFEKNDQLRELVFKVPETEKLNSSTFGFVEFVSKILSKSYSEALEQINEDFKLKLIANEKTKFEDFKEDGYFASANGILEKTFNPKVDTPKENDKGFLFLNGVELIGPGGIGMIIGQPNSGKSPLCDTLCMKFNNPSIDAFGFEFNTPPESKILNLDMERSERLLFRNYQQIIERSKINNPSFIDKVVFLSYKSIANRQPFENRKTKLERDVLKYKPSVLIIDGVAKIINDMNNLNECTDFIRWLANLAEENNLAILITIHANPSDLKAQGHLGSALLRECESVLALKYDKTKDSTHRELTTMFQHGKVRSGSNKVETWFEWSDEQCHFISAQKKSRVKETNSEENLKMLVIKAFEGVSRLSYKQLGEKMAKITGKSYDTERRKIKDMVQLGLITIQDKLYMLNSNVNVM